MKRNRRYNKWRYAYANGFVVLAEGLDMFRLGLLTLAGKRTCPLRKELWLVGWMSGSLTQRDGIALAEGLSDSRGGNHFG
jgi:hypothetical protein